METKLNLKAQDRVFRTSFQIGFVFCLIQILILLTFYHHLPPQLPLFYSRPWGEEQLTNPLGLLALPSLSLGIILINLITSWSLFRDRRLIKQILSVTAAVFNFLCLITLVQIIKLVAP